MEGKQVRLEAGGVGRSQGMQEILSPIKTSDFILSCIGHFWRI